MKQKILFIITQGGPWGGAQKYVTDLASGIAEEFLPIVAIGEPYGILDVQNRLKDNPEIDVIQLKHLRRDISPLHDLLAVFELHRLYKKIKPDIIHLNSTKAGVLGSLAKQLLSLTYRLSPKLIYTVHGWIFHEPMNGAKRLFYRVLEQWTAKRKTKIIVLSEADAVSGKGLGILPDSLCIIPTGIDARKDLLSRHDARAILRELLGQDIPMDTFWITCIANHYQTKGLDTLLRALANAGNAVHNAHTILIGDGPERNNLKKLRDDLGLQNSVHFAEFLNDAPQYLPAFDLFVLASRKEGLPYTLIEAKLQGIPIIATDVGGVASIIENKKTGTLVPKENILALAEALKHAVLHHDLARHMADAGMTDSKAECFSKTRMIENTKALYRSLLRGGG